MWIEPTWVCGPGLQVVSRGLARVVGWMERRSIVRYCFLPLRFLRSSMGMARHEDACCAERYTAGSIPRPPVLIVSIGIAAAALFIAALKRCLRTAHSLALHARGRANCRPVGLLCRIHGCGLVCLNWPRC